MMAIAERLFGPLVQIRDRLARPTAKIARDGVLQPNLPARPAQARPQVATTAQDALTIPCPDPTAEERTRDAHQKRGQRLARLDDWDVLAEEIATVDQARHKTMGGTPVAELMAYGARADVVGAVEHALITGRPDPGARLLDGIEALEQVLADHPGSLPIVVIVAQTHMDLGWAWRGTGWDVEVPQRNREAFAAHFDRAADILSAFDADQHDSPLLASCWCALTTGRGAPVRAVVNRYERWIALDPSHAGAYRAMGNHLLPRWQGSYDRLELEARRAAGRTHDIWGAGAYAWVMFDAIATDPEACARVDLDFFLDGLTDILARTNDQHTVNLLAAYCANTMGAMHSGHDETDYIRMQIAAVAKVIVRGHLTELHPMLWAHAARGFDNALRVRCIDRFAASGYADALRYLTQLFRRELAAGNRVIFTKDGVTTEPA